MASPAYWDLTAIWGHDVQHIYATGTSSFILHYDGYEWRTIDTSPFHGDHITVWSSLEKTIVGGDGQCLVYDGEVWAYLQDGKGFTPVDEEDSTVAVWGPGPGNVFIINGYKVNEDAGGGGGSGNDKWNIWHYSDGALSKEYTQYTALRDIDGFNRDNVFAVGDEGIIRYDGTGWVPLGVHGAFRVIWSTPRVMFVISEGGEMYRMMISPHRF